MEFDPDEYQKFKYRRYVQKSDVPTPLRALITTWEQTQTFLLKKFDLRQFLHTICCDKHCNTNQLGKRTFNVKLLAVLNYRYKYIFLNSILQKQILFNVHKVSNEDYRIKRNN